jgi:hypothetical protein
MSDNRSLMEQAVAAAKQKDFASARTLLRQLLKQEPSNLNAWLLAAHVVETRSDAIGCYRQVLRLDPGHAYARQKLAQLESQMPASAPAVPSNERPVPIRSEGSAPAKKPILVRLEPSAPPPVSAPQPASPPSALPARPKTPASEAKTGIQVLLGVLVVLLCLAVVGIVFVVRGGQLLKPANPTPTADQLFNVLYQNSRAANLEDVAGYMATIHSKSPLYNTTEETLPQIFSIYNLEFYFYDLQVISLKANEARIHFALSTRRLGGPAFQNNVVVGTMILRPDEGVWKIYDQDVEDVEYY